MQGIDVEDVFLSLVNFPLDPVTVEVAKQVVDILCSCGISIPFSNVEAKQGFIRVTGRLVVHNSEMASEVIFQVLVKVFAEEMCFMAVSMVKGGRV
jgi:hypothetical protein